MRRSQQLKFILGVAFLALLFYAGVQLFSENDETRVRRSINLATLALEKQDTAGYSRYISESYLDDYGNNKGALLDVIAAVFKEYKPYKADVKKLIIRVEGSSAEADIGFKCYFKRVGDKQLYYDTGKIKATFHKVGRLWKVIKLEYQGVQDVLFLPAVA